MIHTYLKKEGPSTFILLHGTGGNESDLIPLATYIDTHASLLGIRGNVLENGMPRFFKRLSFGVFDQESLLKESEVLYQCLLKWSKTYDFDLKKTVMLGYSNGANMLAYLLNNYPLIINQAILLHPMVPSEHITPYHNNTTQILITAGTHDQMIPMGEAIRLKKKFEEMSFNVTLKTFESGHQLTQEELSFVKEWYKKRLK